MTLVRFYFNNSPHSSEIFYFSERGVITSSLVLCLVHDHVFRHAINTKHEYNYNKHTLHYEISIDTVTSRLCTLLSIDNCF